MESLNALFLHSTEGIIIANKKGQIIKANPSSERLFGYNENELVGLSVEALIPSRFKKGMRVIAKTTINHLTQEQWERT
jgi:PAS domain S-box-containing protein